MSAFSEFGVAGLIGTAAGFLGAVLKDIIAARRKTDTELRELRTPVYKELWKLTEQLPKWPRAELQRYGAVQDALADALHAHPKGKVPDPVYDAIRVKCSALRTEMTDDLLSRREGSRIFA